MKSLVGIGFKVKYQCIPQFSEVTAPQLGVKSLVIAPLLGMKSLVGIGFKASISVFHNSVSISVSHNSVRTLPHC